MKRALKFIIIAVLITSGIIGYKQYVKKKNKPTWRMESVSVGDIREVVTSSGTLNPLVSVNVGTEISGTILKLYKDYNSTVKKGEILAKLDTENLETALESTQTDVQRAQTAVNDAKLDLDLQKQLVKNNMGTEYDLQKARNKYEQAVQALESSRLTIKRAEKNLQNAIIVSPIDGVIISRNVDEGQTVAASLNAPTLFVIANNLRQMQITAAIDEADIGKIKVGLPVEFTVDAYANEEFEGKVNQVRLSPTTEQNVVTYNVIIDVANPEMKLLPGMTANVTVIIRQKENVIRIPDSATRFKPSKEIWKLFGLKWNEELYGKKPFGKGSSNNSGNNSAAKTETNQQTKAVPASKSAPAQEQLKGKTMPAFTDSQKAAFAKLSPEQRKAMREKMGSPGERPDFSKMSDAQKAAFRQKMQQQAGDKTGEKAAGMFSFAGGKAGKDRQRKTRVWVLKNNEPVMIDVVTGLSDGNFSEVLEGLSEGQEVIIGVNYKTAKQLSNAASLPFGGGGMGRH